jgi:hypothetical protein
VPIEAIGQALQNPVYRLVVVRFGVADAYLSQATVSFPDAISRLSYVLG